MQYLIDAGNQFANQYPKLAQRLDMHATGSDDPHVARLLESFAFLTAQLQMKVDDQFTAFTSALLSVLYPQFLNSVPSAAIVKFSPLPRLATQL